MHVLRFLILLAAILLGFMTVHASHRSLERTLIQELDTIRAERDGISRYIAAYRHVPHETAIRYAVAIQRESKAADVPVLWVLAVVRQESHFVPTAVSNQGAIGLMQVMPFWAEKKVFGFLSADHELFDPETNIRAGVHILAHYKQVCGAQLERVLACYHGGPRARFHPKPTTVAYVGAVSHRIRTIQI